MNIKLMPTLWGLTSLLMSAGTYADNCLTPETSLEISSCLGKELRDADEKINQSFNALMGRLTVADQSNLRRQQRIWIKERDAACKLNPGGRSREKWYQDLLNDYGKTVCVTRYTHKRIAELERMSAQGQFDALSASCLDDANQKLASPHASGKWYFELEVNYREAVRLGTSILAVGVNDSGHFTGTIENIRSQDAAKGSTIFGIAADLDSGKLYISRNGAWKGGAPESKEGSDIRPGRDYSAQYLISADSIIPYLASKALIPNLGDQPMKHTPPAGYLPWQSKAATDTKHASNVHNNFLHNFNIDRNVPDNSFAGTVVKMVYDDNEKHLLIGHESGQIDIWDLKQAQSKRVIKAHDHRANLLAFSSDGGVFFSNSYFERTTKIWNAESGDLIYSIPNTSGPVSTTADEQLLVIANEAQLRLFDLANKSLLPEKYNFSSGVITAIANDSSSSQIAVGTASGTIYLLKLITVCGKPALKKIASANPGAGWIIGLRFASNGQGLYSVSRFGLFHEWTTQPLEIVRSLPTDLKQIYSTSLEPENGLLVLAGTNNTGRSMVEIFSPTTGLIASHTIIDIAEVEYLSPLSLVITPHNLFPVSKLKGSASQ